MNRNEREESKRVESSRRLALVLILFSVTATISFAQASKSSAVTGELSLSQPLTVRWRFPSEATLNLTPAADADRVYLPLAAGELVALRASDGQLLWKSDVGGEFSAAPAADDHSIFVSSEETVEAGNARRPAGSIRALGREGGVTLWRYVVSSPIRGGLAVSEEKVFGGASDGNVFALDKKTGNVLWFSHYGAAFNCLPVVNGKSLYLGSEDGAVFSLDEATGKTNWRFKTDAAVRGAVSVSADTVYFGSADGYVYAVNEQDGRLRWRARTGAGVQSVRAVDKGLLVSSLDNFVYLLSLNRGGKVWKHQLPGRISSTPLTAKDTALFTPLSSEFGVVLALKDGKQVNSLPTGLGANTAASPILVEQTVFLTTEHGLLAFTRPSAKPTGRAAGDAEYRVRGSQ